MKTRTIGAVTLALGFLLCGGGAIVVALTPDVPPTTTPLVTPAPRTIGSGGAKSTAVTIAGDDIVHVGVDAPAGTYRAAERLSAGSLCYWAKSRDAEGDDITDNDIPAGGRPQVTLRKGEWFTSRGCPEWRRV